MLVYGACIILAVPCENVSYMDSKGTNIPASIFYKSIAGRYRPVSYPDGPITARYRFIKNAYWDACTFTQSVQSAPFS